MTDNRMIKQTIVSWDRILQEYHKSTYSEAKEWTMEELKDHVLGTAMPSKMIGFMFAPDKGPIKRLAVRLTPQDIKHMRLIQRKKK